MLIAERIKMIIKSRGLSPSQFSVEIGVKPANLSHILSGRNNPSMDFLAKVITAYPNINASWLLTGVTREDKGGDTETKTQQSIKLESSDKRGKITQIVHYFEDGTFELYSPKHQ